MLGRKRGEETEMGSTPKTKAQLLEDNRRLRQQVKELKDQLEQSESYVAAVVHDLRSPIVAIRGLARHLSGKYENPDGPKATIVNQIARMSEPLQTLVENIGRFQETKMAPLKIEDFNFLEVLEILREEFLPRINAQDIELVEPQNTLTLRASKLGLMRALRNYISNALNYGGTELNRITIGCEETEEYFVFSVYNDGGRIKKADCQRIFKKFERQKNCNVAGSGLGLAIVKEIAKRHKGQAWAEPGKRRGVTFFISISKSL